MPAELHAFEQADDVTRALPHAMGPEKSLLSAMLQYPSQMIPLAIELGITPEHFYTPAHSTLFGVLLTEAEAGNEIELVSLVQKLLDRGKLDRIGGPATLTDLYTYAPSTGSFPHHAKLVEAKFILRSVIQFSNEAIGSAYDAPEEVDELLDTLEGRFLAIRASRGMSDGQSTPDAVAAIVAAVNAQQKGEAKLPGLSTGFLDVDGLGADLQPGEVFVVAARPGVGKTSWMMNVVEHLAVDRRIPCGVFSIEMPRAQILQRTIASRAGISWLALEKGYRMTPEERTAFGKAAREIADSPLYLDDTGAIPIGQLRAKARRWHRNYGIQLLAVDYAQLIKSLSKQAQGSREREVSEVSAGIKSLAKELGIPIILLAQLNRAGENRTGKAMGKPRVSDLRESGSLEQDADIVGLLYREELYCDTKEKKALVAGQAEIHIAKNRGGETGIVPLTYLANLTRFESSAREPEPEVPAPAGRFQDEEAFL